MSRALWLGVIAYVGAAFSVPIYLALETGLRSFSSSSSVH
jgi:hypothetical protein